MRCLRSSIAVAAITSVAILAACSSSSSNNVSGGGTCTPLADGSYTEHFTATVDAGKGCPPADTTYTVGGDPDAGQLHGCTLATDSTTCKTTVTCDILSDGYETKVNGSYTPSSDGLSASGAYTTSETGPDGGVLSQCSATVTLTKK